MDADSFVSRLRAAAPAPALLRERGLSRPEIEFILASFVVRPKEAGPAARAADPLLDLVSRYDASGVTIGALHFAAGADVREEGVVVGFVEEEAFEDPLLIEAVQGKIEIREATAIERLIRRCARNGGCFLDATIRAAEHFTERIKDMKLAEDVKVLRAVSEECARFAGGLEFAPFYEGLFKGPIE
jgi:hypothetical protein